LSQLVTIIDNATASAQRKITSIQQNSSAVSIGDMFEMQILMNNLSQLSEMSTAVVAASNSAIKTMATNIRG
jgi:hypothetical protein